jgi:hypothetical protein
MKQVIRDYLERAKVGRKQSYRNLSVFPLLSPYDAAVDYILLDEALEQGLIEVVEVDEGGSVPQLKVVNRSSKQILILDGEELVGAKQNRIVNVSILIQKRSTTVVPVSCVEQGRWSYDTPRFHSEKRIAPSGLRAMKAEQVHRSMRTSGDYRSDQGAIWDRISEQAERRSAESPSMAMASIFEKETSSLDQYVSHFKLVEMQVGALFMINGKVAGLDSFGKSDTFSAVFEKLVRSYALDAIDWFEPDAEFKTLKGDVTRFIETAAGSDIESRPSVGLGDDGRLVAETLTGFFLSVDHRLLHLSVFGSQNSPKRGRDASRMERFSERRRLRR